MTGQDIAEQIISRNIAFPPSDGLEELFKELDNLAIERNDFTSFSINERDLKILDRKFSGDSSDSERFKDLHELSKWTWGRRFDKDGPVITVNKAKHGITEKDRLCLLLSHYIVEYVLDNLDSVPIEGELLSIKMKIPKNFVNIIKHNDANSILDYVDRLTATSLHIYDRVWLSSEDGLLIHTTELDELGLVPVDVVGKLSLSF